MTLDKVKALIASQLGISQDKITPDSKLIEDLGADSLDTVEMLMTLEDDFGIKIPDEEAEKLSTVQSIVELIESKQNQQAGQFTTIQSIIDNIQPKQE